MTNRFQDRDIAWAQYRPPEPMRGVIDAFNELSLDELRVRLPDVRTHKGIQATFKYRIFSDLPLEQVEKVYIVLGGFAERVDSVDAGIKGLLIDLLAKQVDPGKCAVLLVGGLFSFRIRDRATHIKNGSGSMTAVASEVAVLVGGIFTNLQRVVVSGYSMGGVLAPLVAYAVMRQDVAAVEMVCTGEPAYSPATRSRRQLLKHFSVSSRYRNEQIRASNLREYVAVKKSPRTRTAKMVLRARIYRPLFLRFMSMRLVIHDLALQAESFDVQSLNVQFAEALRALTRAGIPIYILHAENSIICDSESITRLVADLRAAGAENVGLVRVRGVQADHGVEEQRSLTTPFLVRPDLYLVGDHSAY